MAGDEATQPSGDRPNGIGDQLVSLLMQALPAIAGAIGFVGFVAILGAAIDWVRFSSAGLPADQAVRVIARSELVATGAVSLIVFSLLGLLAALVAYMLDSRADATPRLRRGITVIATIELLVTLWFARPDRWVYAAVLIGAIAFAMLAGWLIGWGRRWLDVSAPWLGLSERIDAARRELRAADEEASAMRAAFARIGGGPSTRKERQSWLDVERRRALAVNRLEALLAEADAQLGKAELAAAGPGGMQ